MQVEVGQQVTPGTNLARVVEPQHLKAELRIAETQAKDIKLGQQAGIDTRNGVIQGHVSRIDPAAQQGTVTVDVALDEQLPEGARPDLTVDGTIELERLSDVIYVGRPAFGQSQSTVSMFKLEPDGKAAVRVNVKLGRNSVSTIEIVEGLQPGDQVILSDTSAWDAYTSHPFELKKTPRENFNRKSLRQSSIHPRREKLMSASAKPIIRLEDIQKVFYTDEVETHALSGIHLEIRDGEYVSIAGPSGCGKSTLLSLLGLLDSPTEGGYWLNGESVSGLPLSERARIRNREIGFIFQSFNLIGDLTVYENVELPLTYRGMSAAERKQRVTEALERVGMAHRAKHLPSQLSGGQQQRVAVARAVAGQPAILLADEPTGNLDSINGEAVMSLLQELHKGGATICMVTHDQRYARHADREIHLFDGRVVEERAGLSIEGA